MKALTRLKAHTDVVPRKLRRSRSLADQAADEIRALIIDGRIQLGEALSEVALASSLGVSKTPVREALLRLEGEGLVDVHPQRGTFVFQMTAAQVAQLGEMRELLELAAVRLAMARGPEALAEALEAVLALMAEAIERNDWSLYRSLDGRFHGCFIAHSGNAFFEACYAAIAFRVNALRNRLSQSPELNRRSFAEHRAFADAVRRGDCDRLLAGLSGHIRATTREYVETLQGREP